MKRIFIVTSLVLFSFTLAGCTDTSDLESRIAELESSNTTLNEEIATLEETVDNFPIEISDNEAPTFSHEVPASSFEFVYVIYFNDNGDISSRLEDYTSNPEILQYEGASVDDVFFLLADEWIKENITANDNVDGDISANIISIKTPVNITGALEITYTEVYLFVADSSGNAAIQIVTFVFVHEDTTM